MKAAQLKPRRTQSAQSLHRASGRPGAIGAFLCVLSALCGLPVLAWAADLHTTHKGVKDGCAACHAAAPKDAGEWKPIGHDTCAPCHAEFGARPLKAGDALKAPRCVPCHPAAGPKDAAPRPALTFGHAVHKPVGSCDKCHAVKDGVMVQSLPMYSCVTCHEDEGRRMTCATCHVTPPKGAAGGRGAAKDLSALLPKAAVPGIGHGPGWGRAHAKVAVARKATCAECHDDGIAAKKKVTECSQCHAAQTFCAGCHQRTGVAPYGASAGPAAKSRHPQGWSGPVKTAGHHSLAAQRDISVCASCHEEKSCIGCHGAQAKGGKGVSPHAAGIADNCGALLSRNETACLKCHERADLKRRCLPSVQILH